ncbi:MAG: hypothetical protein HZB41_05460 [Ignavibacteriae bacterium]|nr:hypothetical protein [Ignavibacteriota bacterium]
MKSEFEYKGWWWLPEKPQDKVPGIAYVKQGKFTELKLLGGFQNDIELIKKEKIIGSSKPITHSLILGHMYSLEYITLYDCIGACFGGHQSAPVSSFYQSFFHAKYALHNIHFFKTSAIKLRSFSIEYSYLNDWADADRGQKEILNKRNYLLKSKYTNSIKFKINEDILLYLNFWNDPLYSFNRNHKIGIDEIAFLRFISRRGLSIEQCVNLIIKMQDFISLAVQRPVFPISISCSPTNSKSYNYTYNIKRNSMQLYLTIKGEPNEYTSIMRNQMIFSYSDIKEYVDTALSNWLNKIDGFGIIYQLYFSVLFSKSRNIEDKFINYIHAIEGFHRKFNKGKFLMEKKEFNNKVYKPIKKLLDVDIEPNLIHKILSSLKYNNQPSLKDRLIQIFSEFNPDFIKHISIGFINSKELIDYIVDTRNYFSHLNEEKEQKIDFNKLPALNNRLKIILEWYFLKIMGLPQNKIENIVIKSLYDRY